MLHPSEWLKVKKAGLYCIPGDFYIDPKLPVDFAVITHAHADHAITGHKHVLSTPETIAILNVRYGSDFATHIQPLFYESKINHKEVCVYFLPAGHILGSAQIVIEYKGVRVIVSGDYKRMHDPTCLPFQPLNCDLFITEATFGLPIFQHPPISNEISKLLDSLKNHPESCHVLGVYSLGKCQRLISELRRSNYHEAIYIHPAKLKLCEVYQNFGLNFGELILSNTVENRNELKGKILLVTPNAIHDRWVARLPHPILGLATGWMQVRSRAKQNGVELPLIISDHADWNELTQTIHEINPQEIWVTHGQEDALVYYAQQQGFHARALEIWRDEMESEA